MKRTGVGTSGLFGDIGRLSIRRAVCGCCRRVLRRSAREVGPRDLARSAIVFSPHFDDETLGCGGTILEKRRAGARVNIVFMTDGSKSHRDYISERELIRIRQSEGLAAAQVLGVAMKDVVLLGFEETKLMDHLAPATELIAHLLAKHRPREVFIPYHREPPADHVATNRIVLSALHSLGQPTTVYEYPIWFWQRWPWMDAPGIMTHWKIRRAVKEMLVSNAQFMARFRWRVYIGDVLDAKRSALQRHRSQMIRLYSDPRWPTLGDVSEGEFLECFFQEYEYFSRHVFRGSVGGGRQSASPFVTDRSSEG